MLRLLWPTRRKPDPTLLGRLGRVLHWGLTLYAVLLLVTALLNFQWAATLDGSTGLFNVDGTPSTETPEEAAAWHERQGTKWLLQGIGAFIAGRVARYVLAAE